MRPSRRPARAVALLALAGRRREHPVLGGDPAEARAGAPARHALLDRGGADDARPAAGDQRRARSRCCTKPGSIVTGAARRRARPPERSGLTALMPSLRREVDLLDGRRAGVAGNGCRACGRPQGRRWTGSGSRPRRWRGSPRPREPSACSTWRASAAPEVTISTPRPSIRWSIGRIERVVRAAEDDGVDARLAQRRDIAANDVDDVLVEGEPAWMIGASSGVATETRSTCGSTAWTAVDVGAARDGRGRREQADPPVARRRDRLDGLGAHDAEHVDPERRLAHPLAQRGQRGGRRRVAGDDEQLRAAREQLLGDLQG